MEEVSSSTLAKRIKVVRKSRKKTQDDVTKASGVSKNTISDWERGLKQPGILNFLNYCSVPGIRLDELLAAQGKTHPCHQEETESVS